MVHLSSFVLKVWNIFFCRIYFFISCPSPPSYHLSHVAHLVYISYEYVFKFQFFLEKKKFHTWTLILILFNQLIGMNGYHLSLKKIQNIISLQAQHQHLCCFIDNHFFVSVKISAHLSTFAFSVLLIFITLSFPLLWCEEQKRYKKS